MTEKYLVCGVAVENTLYHFDKLYDYVIPESCEGYVQKGCRVMVNFRNSLRQGMIMELHRTDDISGLKHISELLDEEPVMSEELVKLAFMMKDRCFCTLFCACRAMLPTGLSLKVMYSYKANNCVDISTLSETEKQIYIYLKSKKTSVRHDNLLKAMGLSDGNIFSEMYKKNILSRTETVKKRLQDITVKMVHLENYSDDTQYTPNQQEVINTLLVSGDVSRKEICYFTGVSGAVVDNLVKKGVCSYYDSKPPELPKDVIEVTDDRDIVLTPQQQKAFDSLIQKYCSDKPEASLLYGITGSGKTSVFMKLIDRANADGKGVICMVPEIALTPQLLAKFKARYGNKIAVFHSGLSLSERLKEWKRVKNKEANIAVGTRSAIFAPLTDIGLIVIDEEQEYTYKSSSSPRFHARELAKIRCVNNNALLLMSSATPSIESFYFASESRYSLETLDKRYGTAKLPDVITVDMNDEIYNKGNMSEYSSVLLDALNDNLRNKHQSIILLNRRGYNTFVTCMSCREVINCPNCSISLTFHSANQRLMCHYCGYSIAVPRECPSCRSDKLRYAGVGTQKAEKDLQGFFPQARIVRLDTDSTMRRFSYEKKLEAFRSGEYDIMLGTQMVAKGLDFPNVTLVGVLSADLMLHSDDFRSYERTFSLLTQVAGRSGRGELSGKAVIQTYEPENPIIHLAACQDYSEFYKSEILMRKAMLYPPFSDICVVAFIGKNMDKTRETSEIFSQSLSQLAKSEYGDLPMRVIGPSPALVSKINNKYRYRIIIKTKNTKRFREMLSRLLVTFGKDRTFSDVTVYADIDPENVS